MYCPLNDGHIIGVIEQFAQETFEHRIPGFQNVYGTLELQGTNDFQKLICRLPVIHVEKSDILLFDKVVADYEHEHRLAIFWEKNQMELQKPSIPKSTDRELFFVVAALMQLKAFWDESHKAEKRPYTISAADSYLNKDLRIQGYYLKNVRIALKDDCEVSVEMNLGHDITIRLSDITVFGAKDLIIHDEKHLYELITNMDLHYNHDGSLIAPCIEEKLMIPNHLKGICWMSQDELYQVHVERSEALTKLKLNEKGVEARAETVATSRILIGCSASNMRRSYQLIITHGLVVDIRCHGQPIFVAYVPQERFMKE
jgi:hypothetical protein